MDTQKGMLSSASGRWTQDGDSPLCESCGSPFSFFNRRHHCRKCGSLVCGDCSPHKRRALVQTEAESRVCTICHNAFAYIDEIARARELPPEFEAEPSEAPPAAAVPNRPHQQPAASWGFWPALSSAPGVHSWELWLLAAEGCWAENTAPHSPARRTAHVPW